MTQTPDADYWVLGFFGFDATKTSAWQTYQLALELNAEANQVPAFLGATAKGFGHKVSEFAEANRRLQKVNTDTLTTFVIHSSDAANTAWGGCEPAGFCYWSDQDIVHGSDRSYAIFATMKADPEWLESVSRRICQILKPAYGIGFKRMARLGPIGFALGMRYGFGYTKADEDETNAVGMGDWGEARWWGVYKKGFLRDVYEMNFVSSCLLQRTIAGIPLADWIIADAQRGTLSCLTDEMWLWKIAPEHIAAIRERLRAEQFLFRRDNPAAMQVASVARQRWVEAEQAKKRKPNRKKLIALLRALEERYGEDGAERPVVSIEEFFPGNTVDQSIAANLSPHPGLKTFRDVLKRIRGKDTVQDVLIAISDSPMPPETDDAEFEDDDWPYSEEVYVLTSSSPAEVEKWAAKLQPDNVLLTQWFNNQPPKGAPQLQPGMQIIRLWWD